MTTPTTIDPGTMDTGGHTHDHTNGKAPHGKPQSGASVYTIQQAAAVAKRTPKTIRRWINLQELPAALVDGKNGQQYQIAAADLAAHLAGLDTPTHDHTFHMGLNGHGHPAGNSGHPTQRDHTHGATHDASGDSGELAALRALVAEKDARIGDLRQQLEDRSRGESELRQLLLASHSELSELRRLALPGPSSHDGAHNRPESDQEHPAGPMDSPESERPAAPPVAAGHPTIVPAPTPTDQAHGTELQEGPTAPTAKRLPWWRRRIW